MNVYVFDIMVYEPFCVSYLQSPFEQECLCVVYAQREYEYVSINGINYFRENTENHTKCQQ